MNMQYVGIYGYFISCFNFTGTYVLEIYRLFEKTLLLAVSREGGGGRSSKGMAGFFKRSIRLRILHMVRYVLSKTIVLRR